MDAELPLLLLVEEAGSVLELVGAVASAGAAGASVYSTWGHEIGTHVRLMFPVRVLHWGLGMVMWWRSCTSLKEFFKTNAWPLI